MAKRIPSRFILMILVSGLLTLCFACKEKADSVRQQNNAQSGQIKGKPNLFTFQKESETQINFWGIIVDQNGAPVGGADIEVSLYHFNPLAAPYFESLTRLTLRSGEDGRFSLVDKKGLSLDIDKVNKPGYDEVWRHSDISDKFVYGGEKQVFVPDHSKPVVFLMRKIGEVTFLLDRQLGFGSSPQESGQETDYDLIRGMHLTPELMKKGQWDGLPVYPDIKSKVVWDAEAKSWSLELFNDAPGGGFLLSDDLLFTSPPTGYEQKVYLDAKHYSGKIHYLYIKSRTPPIYSRIDFGRSWSLNEWPFLKRGPQDSEDFSIRGYVVTNPYGDPVLESPKNLPFEVKEKLGKEVQDAFASGKRPEKPDVQKYLYASPEIIPN